MLTSVVAVLKNLRLNLVLAFLCLSSILVQAQRGDTGIQVERLGNPFAAALTSPTYSYARNIWDMAVYNGLLYLGHGNSNNDGPAPNAGPVGIWTYDGARFRMQGKVNDEQIEQFIELDGELFIPGHDSVYPMRGGNIYRKRGAGAWREYTRVIPEVAHVYDLARFEGRLFAATNASTLDSSAVFVSDDEGESWRGLPLNLDGSIYQPVAWELFTVGDTLLVSAQPAIFLIDLGNGNSERQTYGVELFRYENGIFIPLDTDPFPNFTADINRERSLRVARPVEFAGGTVYLGARVNQQQWTPFGLFFMRWNDQALEVIEVRLPDDSTPWDLWYEGSTLYVLTNACLSAVRGACSVSVWATCDLSHWHPILRFDEPSGAFARSFARYQDHWYFGLGSLPDYFPDTVGDILRISGGTFACG